MVTFRSVPILSSIPSPTCAISNLLSTSFSLLNNVVLPKVVEHERC